MYSIRANEKFKYMFKFKLRNMLTLSLTMIICVSADKYSSDYVQSFERIAVFHNHVTYGHLGVPIDLDGYLNQFHVL